MSQISRPWNGTTVGDAGPYTDAQWQKLYQYIIGLGAIRSNTGVFLGSGTQPNDGLRVTAQSPAAAGILVLPGSALVQGIAYMNDADVPLVVAANASGNPRIDTVVVQADYALQECRLAILQGTPAASPVPPTLTQIANTMWEIPVADVAAANGFTTIAQGNITPRQEWVNAPPGVYLDNVFNNSGAALEDGDVVIWDNTATRAVTTTVIANSSLAAGVWRGRNENGAYGRLQTKGIGYVRTNAAVAIGNILVTSTTARQAGVIANAPDRIIGRVLETTLAAGLALTAIDVSLGTGFDIIQIHDEKASGVAAASIVSGAWRTRELTTIVSDTAGLSSLPGSNRIRLAAGTYEFWICAPVASNSSAVRLFNFTDTAVIQEGAHGVGNAFVIGLFTIAAQKDLEIQQRINVTANGGLTLTTGANEVYTTVYLRRRAGS